MKTLISRNIFQCGVLKTRIPLTPERLKPIMAITRINNSRLFFCDELSKHICKLYCDWNQSTDTHKNVIDELKNLPVPIPNQVVSVRPIGEIQKRDDSSREETDTPLR